MTVVDRHHPLLSVATKCSALGLVTLVIIIHTSLQQFGTLPPFSTVFNVQIFCFDILVTFITFLSDVRYSDDTLRFLRSHFGSPQCLYPGTSTEFGILQSRTLWSLPLTNAKCLFLGYSFWLEGKETSHGVTTQYDYSIVPKGGRTKRRHYE